jgi:hypothetical protein
MYLVDRMSLETTYDATESYAEKIRLQVGTGSREWSAVGVPATHIPLRHRSGGADGRPAVLRIVKSPVRWHVNGRMPVAAPSITPCSSTGDRPSRDHSNEERRLSPDRGTTLADGVTVVTGAGQGLGRAHALFTAEQGAVVVNDVGTTDGIARAEMVVAEIHAAGGTAVGSGHDVVE